jgi:hypothetical protein
MSATVSSSRVAAAAYKRALQIYKVLDTPAVQHIVSYMEANRDVEARDLTTNHYSKPTILKYIRVLVRLQLVRRDRLGSEVSYRLNYDRLDNINAAAARLL